MTHGPGTRHEPAVVVRRSTAVRDCRCGSRIEPDSPHLEVEGLSQNVSGMFENQTFCSYGCVRAQFLEVLTTLEALDTPRAKTVVTDLRTAYADLAATYADLRNHWDIRRPAG